MAQPSGNTVVLITIDCTEPFRDKLSHHTAVELYRHRLYVSMKCMQLLLSFPMGCHLMPKDKGSWTKSLT